MATIDWDNSALNLTFTAADDAPVTLVDIRSVDEPSAISGRARQPLVEILTPRWGNDNSGSSARHSGSRIGSRLRYVAHEATVDDGIARLSITQSEPGSGLVVISSFAAPQGIPAVHTSTTVQTLPGAEAVTLWAVTSFATGAVISDDINRLDIWSAETSWCAENRWSARPLREWELGSGTVPAWPEML